MYLPDLISTGFLVLSTAYFICAFTILSYDIHSVKHRLLFFSFLGFTWWAFAFAIANNAPDAEAAVFWRRLASIGWGSVFSFLLHYTLLLTDFKLPLKKQLIHIIIYLPAVINVFLYGILDVTALSIYNMQKTQTGWVNAAELSALSLPHFVSTIGFSLVMAGLLLYWRMQISDKVKRKRSLVFGIIALFSVIAGVLTEYALKIIFNPAFPQLGPLYFIFTAIAMFFYSRSTNLLIKMPANMEPEENRILSVQAQDRLFLYLAWAAIVGSLISFTEQYIFRGSPLGASLAISIILLLTAMTTYITRRLNIKTELKDLITGFILSISLILLTFFIYYFTATHTLLLHSIYIMIAIVFANRKIIFMIAAAVLFSLTVSWVTYPVTVQAFTHIHHAVRATVMIILVSLAMIINGFLRRATADSQEKTKTEKFLSDMAALFMATSDETFDSNVNQILEAWGKHLHADCIKAIFIDELDAIAKSEYQWNKALTDKSSSIVNMDKEIPITPFLNLRHIWDKDYEGSPNDIEMPLSENIQQLKEKIQSGKLTILPLNNIQHLIGIVVIENVTGSVMWQEEHHRANQIASRMLADVWIKIESYKKMRYHALYDSLTSLPNRQYFTERVKQAISMAARTDKLIGFCFIDIDSFKLINDTMGHKAGDQFIRQIAQRLKENLRDYDVAARFGGDEFLIMFPQADDITGIEIAAKRVIESINEPIMINDQNLIVSASMGISVFPYDGIEYSELLKNADTAMYISKEMGKGKITFCSEDIKKELQIRNTLIRDLNSALEKNEMFINYQPVVRVSDERIVGVEALLRWKHPEYGLISPQVFIPLAEQSGIISKIGAWVIYEACLQNKKWQNLGFEPLLMQINISLIQFLDENLVDIVRDAIKRSNLSPHFVELEVTESVSIKSSQNIAVKIDKLKELGIKVAIDDFGSGFSSFGRLNSMHLDKIKVDMQFVHGIGCSNMDEEIVNAIIDLGKKLNITISAEGVESEEQLSFLKENSCDEVQGFYYYKPMDARSIERILSKQVIENNEVLVR